MELVNKIAFVLVIIGGLNWGFYAFGTDLVAYLPVVVAKIVYVLVALSALVLIFAKTGCSDKSSMGQGAGSSM